jgi:hypothetical protein
MCSHVQAIQKLELERKRDLRPRLKVVEVVWVVFIVARLSCNIMKVSIVIVLDVISQ